MELSINRVISVSLLSSPAGLSNFNTSNVALFTREAANPSFGAGTYKIYFNPTDVITDFGSSSVTAAMANALFSQTPNILAGGGYLVVIPFLPGNEPLKDAIVRMHGTVSFFGILQAEIDSQTYSLETAAVVEPLTKMFFCPSADILDIAPGGTLDLLATTGYTHTRGLFYAGLLNNDAADQKSALVFAAGYAGRMLCVDFGGSNTTLTANLKTLKGVAADPGITETYESQCVDCGADTYPSVQGVPSVLSQGANMFFDDVYNALALEGAISVAGFNFLKRTSTKVPQTEPGMVSFKGAFRAVMQQYVRNGYLAPGAWDLPDTFGNQADFFANIEQFGYYIYSIPVSQQSVADRDLRKACLVQIAGKSAGAIHSGAIQISINQ